MEGRGKFFFFLPFPFLCNNTYFSIHQPPENTIHTHIPFFYVAHFWLMWEHFTRQNRTELHPGDYVTISASRYPFPSVLPLDRRNEDWIDSISRTLNWNSRSRQKAFSGYKSKDNGGSDADSGSGKGGSGSSGGDGSGTSSARQGNSPAGHHKQMI